MKNLENQNNVQFPEIAEEINAMRDADQEMRKRVWKGGGIIESEWDDKLDQRNTNRMKEIVEQIGWPTVSKVGERASGSAWLLVQHADHDVKFQSHCLGLMKNEPTGEVASKDIAYLEDRIRINLGQPQVYGTQFRWTEDGRPIQNIEDLENVDARRRGMGLNTLEEGIAEMQEKYKN